MSSGGGSQYRRHRNDVETGASKRHGSSKYDEDGIGPFDISHTKSASLDHLKRWRQAARVLYDSRQFQYTLDLKKEEERKLLIANIRKHSQAVRAAVLFQQSVSGISGTPKKLPAPSTHEGDYRIGQEELASMSKEQDVSMLERYGGVPGVADMLKTNLEKGINGDEDNTLKRKNEFGSNTYPRKKGRSFWNFLWDACRVTKLIILMVAAAASLALGIKTEGIKVGWYVGGSVALAVILVIVVTAVSNYKQSLQFQSLNEEKQNIHLEMMRGGRRVPVSIFDIVVGDVLPLKIGDQIPADGLLIFGHSLAIDESSMTGESKIIHKDSKNPFMMSGTKVADGYCTMLVTGVGRNTEWGLLMASISEDNGEETPLQVRLNGVVTFIGMVGLAVALLVLVVLMIRFFTGDSKDPDGKIQFKAGQTSIGDAIYGAIKNFTVAVTIVVVAVPEWLTLAVTLTLAYSMRKMMAHKALDPCQPGVQEAACVKVRMVTDDNPQTAKAIALQCGILASDAQATKPYLIEGKRFHALSKSERQEVAEKISVMERSSPNDKLLLVQALRKNAVTGDGTNDAPALREVDIGLAMGIAGTEFVRESSDIILDDNFSSVVKVVRWVRCVYANIKYFIQFRRIVKVAALIINVAAVFSSGYVPLNAVQLLGVNLIMYILGARAPATEPPTDHLMQRPPVGRREPLIPRSYPGFGSEPKVKRRKRGKQTTSSRW